MTEREPEPYSTLRATIRERGTTRVCLFVTGIVAWAALTVATAALASTPIATLLPLLVLASVFEAVFALHVGVERIGRYLQVFHDDPWERTAMAFGRPKHAAASDPLFIPIFVVATLFNLTPALFAQPVASEIVFLAGGHALFLLRLVAARIAASRQRAVDLARFNELKKAGQAG